MKKNLLFAAALLFLLGSCVPKRKLLQSQDRVRTLQSDSAATRGKLKDCNASLSSVQNEKAELEKSMQSLSKSSQEALSSRQMTIAEQAKRLSDLQNMIQAQKDVLNKLQKTIADALMNFKPDELTVSVQNGNIYVSLQEKLLFKSGSDVVDPKGKDALKSVAAVLNNNPDINVLIEGHTDSIPIRGKFADNWALSTARATSIVRILCNDYAVDAHRVAAAGRGEYHPVESNSTTEGRARNRRTEIILSPNLSELFKLLGQ